MASPPAEHPDIDWSKWEAPGEGDVRSPCPMLNALANHHILPHDGKNITVAMAEKALSDAINLEPQVGRMFATFAVDTNPAPGATTFDLDTVNRNGYIEHDVSLSRNDESLGNNHSFDPAVWADFLKAFGDSKETSYALASKARYERLLSCKRAHKETGTPMQYAMRDLLLSYGESALYLSLLGDPVNGKIPLEYVKVLVEQERVPYNEGWRRIPTSFKQHDLNRVVTSLFLANEHKAAEALDVGVGTVEYVTKSIGSMMTTHCIVM